jgi:hypothetical protein
MSSIFVQNTPEHIGCYGKKNADLCGIFSAHWVIRGLPDGMVHDDGYWSGTVYDMDDRYLIPNPHNRCAVSSHGAVANGGGTFTIRITPDGSGDNAIPATGKPIVALSEIPQSPRVASGWVGGR